ncbi:putative Copper binding protein 9 [Tripterygium wilfordii]|uniref:Putative Copper binding protein 9 n=1 Tax=Tripterygium wilfordii TaxID=458696 RepID=A0A7J7C533_TRIWF|nr:umecyanin-like [Tripterygium wilfordii]KAF5728876.1 putative Copper binding protein 9 [Tripterygium wilfordii]
MTTVMRMLQVVVMVIAAVSLNGKWVAAHEVHHVVGGDHGWDGQTDLVSWLSGRSFIVGDKIWFAYSAAQGSIAELKSKEEFEACDLSNPIRMYTDGLDSISLDGEGIRYFASSNPENCKNGLKLPVEVGHGSPTVTAVTQSSVQALATAPTSPSCAAHFSGGFALSFIVLWLCYVVVQTV